MARVKLAGVVVAASAAVAMAGPARKITIETDPPGAKVYFNDSDSKPVCERTPCSVEAPVGTTAVVIELDGYGPVIDSIDVPKKGKAGPFKFSLTKGGGGGDDTPGSGTGGASGTIVIEAQSAKGAVVKVDKQEKGKVPVRIEVDPGPHKVTVTKDGVKLVDTEVNVDPGQEVKVAFKGSGAADPPTKSPGGKTVSTKDPFDDPKPDDSDGKDETDDGGDTDGSTPHKHHPKTSIKKDSEGGPRGRVLHVSGVLEVGFRNFTYTAGTGKYMNYSQTEDGQTLAGALVELWPIELAHGNIMRGLSLFGKVLVPLNHEPVLSTMGVATGVSTNWGGYEVGGRYRWEFADTVAVEVGGGYIDEKMSYSGGDASDVPDTEYKSASLRGRLALLSVAPLEPYVLFEPRFVIKGGALKSRFQTAQPDGYHAAVGAVVRIGRVDARVEGGYTHYGWTLTNDSAATDTAQGATDRVLWLSFNAGFDY